MDALPGFAELLYLLAQGLLNRGQLVLCEAKVLPKADRTVRAVQLKDGLVPVPDHVDMRWSVVVWIDDDAQARKPQDGGHSMIVANNPKPWVIRELDDHALIANSYLGRTYMSTYCNYVTSSI